MQSEGVLPLFGSLAGLGNWQTHVDRLDSTCATVLAVSDDFARNTGRVCNVNSQVERPQRSRCSPRHALPGHLSDGTKRAGE